MKYYVTLMDGKGFEVDDLTFNKLTARIKTGRTNGFYTVETGDTKGTSFNFRHIASIYIERNEKELAGWLDAKLIKDDWRPVKLEKGIYMDGEIEFF